MGELGKWEGTSYKVDLSGLNLIPKPVRPHLPLYLPALFTGAVRLAAEIADGLVGHPIWSLRWIREQVIPALNTHLRRAHKARVGFELNLFTYVAANPDGRQALAQARGTVASMHLSANTRSTLRRTVLGKPPVAQHLQHSSTIIQQC